MVLSGNMYKLKEWLTMPDAAQHMSNIFHEEVSETDVLQLALDGHLKLSVNFVNSCLVKRGKIIQKEDVEWEDSLLSTGETWRRPIKGDFIVDEIAFRLNGKIVSIDGVWDLPMIGYEQMDIKREYHRQIGGLSVTERNLTGTYVERRDGSFCQLFKRIPHMSNEHVETYEDNYCYLGSAASYGVLMEQIRTHKIEESVAKEMLDKHWHDREECLRGIARYDEKYPGNFNPLSGLPEGSMFVVRTSVITDIQDRFVKEHGILETDIQENPDTHPLHTQEDFPGDPGEKAVHGWKGIGEYLNRNPDYVRQRWAKEEGFPVNKSKEGRLYAYPTRLNLWRANKEKKDREYPAPKFLPPLPAK